MVLVKSAWFTKMLKLVGDCRCHHHHHHQLSQHLIIDTSQIVAGLSLINSSFIHNLLAGKGNVKLLTLNQSYM